MLKGVIFDFDGTLFDSIFIWDTAGETYLRSIGKEPEANLQTTLKPMSLLQSAQYIREKYHIQLSVEEIMDGVNRTVENFYFYTIKPKAGVITPLEELHRRKIKMCIAAATDRYQVEAVLVRCAMQQLFSGILSLYQKSRRLQFLWHLISFRSFILFYSEIILGQKTTTTLSIPNYFLKIS